ncbi:MAG: TrbI/VirB10 family protein [Gallionella sp.]|nr:TrbI/VirB10 family protein [Gallionella sp.]
MEHDDSREKPRAKRKAREKQADAAAQPPDIAPGQHDHDYQDELRRSDIPGRGQDDAPAFDGEVAESPAPITASEPLPEAVAVASPAFTPSKVISDIAKPKAMLPEWAIWGLLGVLAVGGAGGAAYYFKSTKASKTRPQMVIKDTGVPDDFYLKPLSPPVQREDAPPPKPEPRPAAPVVKVVKLAAADLFSVSPVPPPPPPDPSFGVINAENEARRGSGITRVARNGTLAKPEEFINSQDKYDDEDQQVASYPVNLDRVITVDRFIHATLIQGINAELAGKVVAQIDENVYGAHGAFVLIPAGSRAIGRYKATMKPGDERFDMFWSRIITPAGINIHLGNGEMTDAMGRAGITGDIDNRFWDRYGMALMVSTLGIAGSIAIPVTTANQAVIVQQYGSASMNMAQQILDKNINLRPKITIQPGQPILISPSKDIWFKKPEKRTSVAVALDDLKGASK